MTSIERDGALRPRVRIQGVARVRAADVRANGTVQAERVRIVIHKVVGGGQRRIIGVRRQRERRTAWPAADHLRGEPDTSLRVATYGVVDKVPERAYVLATLAEHQVRAVAAEVGLASAGFVEGQHAIRCTVQERSVGVLAVLVGV